MDHVWSGGSVEQRRWNKEESWNSGSVDEMYKVEKRMEGEVEQTRVEQAKMMDRGTQSGRLSGASVERRVGGTREKIEIVVVWMGREVDGT